MHIPSSTASEENVLPLRIHYRAEAHGKIVPDPIHRPELADNLFQ
jgi:hypothetical protein